MRLTHSKGYISSANLNRDSSSSTHFSEIVSPLHWNSPVEVTPEKTAEFTLTKHFISFGRGFQMDRFHSWLNSKKWQLGFNSTKLNRMSWLCKTDFVTLPFCTQFYRFIDKYTKNYPFFTFSTNIGQHLPKLPIRHAEQNFPNLTFEIPFTFLFLPYFLPCSMIHLDRLLASEQMNLHLQFHQPSY